MSPVFSTSTCSVGLRPRLTITAGVQIFTWAFPGGADSDRERVERDGRAAGVVGLQPVISGWQARQIELGDEMVRVDELNRLGVDNFAAIVCAARASSAA